MTNKTIDLHIPFLKGEEKKFVLNALNKNELTYGSYLTKFSKIINRITGSKYSVPIQNGTAGLFLCLKILNVNSKEEVIVPTITFIASVNCIRYCGASPIFMDTDKTGNIDLEKTKEFIKKNTFTKKGSTFNKKTKKKISAIIIVHTFGNAVNLTSSILNFFRKKNIKVIEDAAESLGSYLIKNKKKKHTGTLGDIGFVSFNGNKIITSSGGGVILTSSKKNYIKINYLINQAKSNNIEFIHDEIGFNFRLSNIHAAIGVAQIQQLKKILQLKKKIYENYKNEINQIKGLFILNNPTHSNSNNWLNVLEITKDYKFSRKYILKKLNKNKISARPVWIPNHLQKPYKSYQKYKIKNSIYFYKNFICLPSSAGLALNNIKKIHQLLK